MTDWLSMLSSLDKPCTKSFGFSDGQWTSERLGHAYNYDVVEEKVSGLDDLARTLAGLETNPHAAIIRGNYKGDLPSSQLRRTLDNFHSSARQWCMIDIDELEIPEEFEDFKNHLPELINVAVSHLPAEFHDVDCWYQFSSSMGIKAGKIRVHLWFWLSQKVSDAEMKAWLSGSPVDLRLFHPVQLHFIAKPIFRDGAVDPLPRRSGTHDAGKGNSTVSVPTDLGARAVAASQKPKHIRTGGVVEAQEIVRDLSTGLAIDGRERLLFELSNEVTKELVRAATGRNPTEKEIADRLWERFSEEADLNDGKWTRADAEKKAAARSKDLENDEFTFTSRSGSNTLLPTARPYYHLNLVSKEVGQQRLSDILGGFFRSVEEGDLSRQVVKITMGSGKTTQAIDYLKTYLQSHSNKLVEIYVPRHDIAKEFAGKLSESPTVKAKVIHVHPRTGGKQNPETGETRFEPLCDRADYVRSLEKAGHSVYRSACKNGQDMCEHFSACKYLNQFRSGAFQTHDGNVIRIYQHAQLGLPRNALEDELVPDLVVVDESFLPSLLDTDQSMPAETLRVHLKTPDKPQLGNLVVDSLRDSRAVLKALRGAGVTNRDLDSVNLEAINPSVGFDTKSSTAKPLADAKDYRALTQVIRMLREEMSIANRDQVERLVYDHQKASVQICLLKGNRIPEHVPLLVLDATADQVLVEKVVGPVSFDQIDIEQKAVVTQVYDHTGSNTWWNNNPERVNELVSVLNEWVAYGETPLCVSHKKLADALLAREDLDDQVKVLNFGGLRGSNDAEDCSVVFITGRNQLPTSAIDQKARALFWDDDTELKHEDSSGDFPEELRGYLLSDRYQGQKAGVQVRAFSDPRIEKLHAQEREAETIQAIARLRLVHSPYVKRVFLLGNLPIEMPVDRLITMDELMPDGLEKQLLEKRNLPITAQGIVKMRPDITNRQNTALQKLKRSSVTDYKTLAVVLPDLARNTIFVARFRAGGERLRQHEHLFLCEQFVTEHDQSGDAIFGTLPPYSDILALLNEGWGEVKDLEIDYWGGAEDNH